MKSARSALRALAERVGILSAYVDASHRLRRTNDESRRALLSAMGYPAPSERAARAWLEQLAHEERSALLDAVRVAPHSARSARAVAVRLPPDVASARIEISVTEERGRTRIVARKIRRSGTVALPRGLGPGYHRLQLRVSAGGREWNAEQSLILTPTRCVTPDERLGAGNGAVGVAANLYAARRNGDWGVGDLTTLTRLVAATASRGGGFVGINPLHAVTNRGGDFSPYSPASRLFRNPIYIDVERVPELAHAPSARALLSGGDVVAQLDALRRASLVDYERVVDLKERVLRELHDVFRARATRQNDVRRRAYRDFLRRSEPEVSGFATWMALAATTRTADWRQFPQAVHDPGSRATLAFRNEHQREIDFHCWLQFELDTQLARAAGAARRMPIGIYQDLAAGSNPGGSDVWNRQALFASEAHIGAPPDPLAPQGQNWGLAPLIPHSLRADRYDYWIRMVRHGLEHSGALRIDHVMGLFRSFWVPLGGSGRDGAYVRMPADDLLGILALESARRSALIVGEDLGTVPADVPPALRRRGVLSTRVLYFERDRGGFRPGRRYPSAALAAANTHDLATIAGWWEGRDLDFRTRHALHGAGRSAESEERNRRRERAQLLRLLHLRPSDVNEPDFLPRLVEAVHAFLRATPARLVAFSLDDLNGERDPVNMPGVGQGQYPSWRRRSRVTVEDTFARWHGTLSKRAHDRERQ